MKFKTWWRQAAVILAVIGPGIITANVDNDAGGITTYSLAGAHFGYALLWAVIPVTVLLIIIQEISARMGVVTGKGLADLIRENYGVKSTVYLMIAFLITNLGNTVSEFAGIAASGEIFGIPKYLSVPVCAYFAWRLIVYGTYKSIERAFLIACTFYITYVVSMLLAQPDWKEVAVHTFEPRFRWEPEYLILLVGIVGSTIAPWMQFYQQSSVVEKGIKPEQYKYTQMDVIVGCILTNIVVFSIMVACAATLFQAGLRIETAQDAALALKPLAGKYCALLFAFGLFNASLFSACILPLSTSQYVCEGLGWEMGLDKHFEEAPEFYSLYTLTIIVGAGCVLWPDFPLIKIMLWSQVINGLLLPFVLIFMLLLVNKKELMGEYVNSRFSNLVSWGAVIIVLVADLAMLAFLAKPLLK